MDGIKIEGQKVKSADGQLTYGSVSKSRMGWHFIPHVAGRRTSRIGWASPEKAIPAWVKKNAKARLAKLDPVPSALPPLSTICPKHQASELLKNVDCLSESEKKFLAARQKKIDALTPRQQKGKRYWELLSRKQRECMLEHHGYGKPKYATQDYIDLTEALKEISNECAITPGGIVPTERLVALGILEKAWYEREKLDRGIRENMRPGSMGPMRDYFWNLFADADSRTYYPDQD